jgi:hypothetical protein
VYVEDLKRDTNKDIGPKDIFEMDSLSESEHAAVSEQKKLSKHLKYSK